MVAQCERVVIGMDPHKRSVTIEVMAGDETILGGGRFGTDAAGYEAMLDYVRQWPERVWAIEGCNGIGRHVALRLLADGQEVVDVPPKLSARARVFATGQGRKTDATDAHSVALVGTRMAGLRPVVDDEQLAVLRTLVGACPLVCVSAWPVFMVSGPVQAAGEHQVELVEGGAPAAGGQ
jgi:transposase